ncbi:MAG: hydroxyethylthiazole kinase [Mongoliitalea sp.]
MVDIIGTLDEYWSDSMLQAAAHAHATRRPWVLDPVGVGATPYCRKFLKKASKSALDSSANMPDFIFVLGCKMDFSSWE